MALQIGSVIPLPTAKKRSSRPPLTHNRTSKLVSAEELLGWNSESIIVHVSGHHLTRLGVEEGDTLVTDLSVQPTSGDFVITLSDDELLLQPVYFSNHSPFVLQSNRQLEPVDWSDIRAVATHLIRRLHHQATAKK